MYGQCKNAEHHKVFYSLHLATSAWIFHVWWFLPSCYYLRRHHHDHISFNHRTNPYGEWSERMHLSQSTMPHDLHVLEEEAKYTSVELCNGYVFTLNYNAIFLFSNILMDYDKKWMKYSWLRFIHHN